jgi:hypothetical protein
MKWPFTNAGIIGECFASGILSYEDRHTYGSSRVCGFLHGNTKGGDVRCNSLNVNWHGQITSMGMHPACYTGISLLPAYTLGGSGIRRYLDGNNQG